MTRTPNFDAVAGFYDPLARMVFGNQMKASQVRFLNSIPSGATLLILGGGTGWILDELFARTADCRVYYVEHSRAMLERAMKHGKGFDITFIQGSWEYLPDAAFDGVITHYFLDLFPEHTLQRVCDTVSASLKEDGMWLVSDFVTSRIWHRAMIWAMYRFFRVMCGISTVQLPNWEECIKRAGFISRDSDFFYGGFMKSMHFVRGSAR